MSTKFKAELVGESLVAKAVALIDDLGAAEDRADRHCDDDRADAMYERGQDVRRLLSQAEELCELMPHKIDQWRSDLRSELEKIRKSALG